MAAPAWSPTQIYRLNEQVTLSTSTWVCTRDFNLNNAPSNSSEWWGAVTGPAAGVTTVATLSNGFPQPPIANAQSITPISLVLPSALESGALYWLSIAIRLRTYNADNAPQAIQFVDSLDVLTFNLQSSSIDNAKSNAVATITGVRDRPGQVNGADEYPVLLTAQFTSAEVTDPLNLVVQLANKSGTMTWGSASTVEVQIYKV